MLLRHSTIFLFQQQLLKWNTFLCDSIYSTKMPLLGTTFSINHALKRILHGLRSNSLSTSSTFWCWTPWKGPPTCLQKGFQITQTKCECLWLLNCMYQISFTLKHVETFVCCRINWKSSLGFQLYQQWLQKHKKLSYEYFHPNIVDVSKDKRSKCFCIDSFSPWTISSTFDSKLHALSVTLPGHL